MDSASKILDNIGLSYKKDEPMSLHTTFRIGGKADYFVDVREEDKLRNLIIELEKNKIPYIVLGWGSNVLVSDDGIRGVVIRNRVKEFRLRSSDKKTHKESKEFNKKSEIRLDQISEKERGIYSFMDLDYDESDIKDEVLVEVSAGMDMPELITKTLDMGLTGLQWYAGIPGTVGGAVFNNIHGGTHLFEEVFEEAEVINIENLKVEKKSKQDMKFDYDESYLHKSGDIILSVTLRLKKGDKDRAIYTAKEWYQRKAIQPRNTPGCVWKNISNEAKIKNGFEANATGYIIDQKLGWRGKKKVGDAIISDKHANFIENLGRASAMDVLKIMKDTRDEIYKKYGIKLESEIIFLGFISRNPDEVMDSI